MLLTYDFCLTNEITLRVYGGVKNLFNQVQDNFDRGIYRDAAYVYGPGQFGFINVGIKLGNL
jgi:outer membrane receptor for ferrienterochelin and colicins